MGVVENQDRFQAALAGVLLKAFLDRSNERRKVTDDAGADGMRDLPAEISSR